MLFAVFEHIQVLYYLLANWDCAKLSKKFTPPSLYQFGVKLNSLFNFCLIFSIETQFALIISYLWVPLLLMCGESQILERYNNSKSCLYWDVLTHYIWSLRENTNSTESNAFVLTLHGRKKVPFFHVSMPFNLLSSRNARVYPWFSS